VSLAFPPKGIHGRQHRTDAGCGHGLGQDEVGAFAEGRSQTLTSSVALSMTIVVSRLSGDFLIRRASSSPSIAACPCPQRPHRSAAPRPAERQPGYLKRENGVVRGGSQRPDEFGAKGFVVDNHDFERHQSYLGARFLPDTLQPRSIRQLRIRQDRHKELSYTGTGVQNVKSY